MRKIVGKTPKGLNKKVFKYKFLKQDFKIKIKDSLINATDGELKTNSVGKVA